MTKSEMKALISNSIEQRNLCRIFFRYDINYWYYFPLLSSDKLFLGAEENDFLINGYSIRRFVDITKLQVKKDKCIEILQKEGITNSLVTPNIDISSWQKVFESLRKMGKNIIVEKESIEPDQCEFTIGKIDRVYKNFVYIYHFDADGIWQDKPFKIPYTEITSVSFGTRYVEMFSKYLGELPEDIVQQ